MYIYVLYIPIHDHSHPCTTSSLQFITWLGVWNMNFMTFHMLGISSSQLTNSIIFQTCRAQPPTRYIIQPAISYHESAINPIKPTFPHGFPWLQFSTTSSSKSSLSRSSLPSLLVFIHWPSQEPIDWRYLPYIRPIFQAYVRGYTSRIWPYMVLTYLHFRILE